MEKTYEIITTNFGTVKGTRAQIMAFRSAIQSEADKSYDRSVDIKKPAPVKLAWEEYWIDCLDELRRIDEQIEKQEADNEH